MELRTSLKYCTADNRGCVSVLASTVVCGSICSVHTGDLEEYLVFGGVLGDCEPALQGWVVVLIIIPINTCQPLQTLP